jgi:hypothetical protein
MVLLESVDSIGRQLEAHLLRLDEIDVEHLCLNVNALRRACVFVWFLTTSAWQHDEGQLPCRFGTTQQICQDLSLSRIEVGYPFDSFPPQQSCRYFAGVLGGHDDRLRACG